MVNNKYTPIVEELIEILGDRKIIRNAFKEIKPVKDNLFSFWFAIILSIPFAIFIALDFNTVSILKSNMTILLNVLLAFFGGIFAVYTIILTFLDEEYISFLVSVKDKNKSYLSIVVSYPCSILILYFLGILKTIIALLFLNCIDNEFVLTDDNLLNNVIAFIFIYLYFLFIIRILYEIKNTIYNVMLIWNFKILYRATIKEKEERIKNVNNN